MTSALLVPEIVAGMVGLVGAVALVSSSRGIARTARIEAAEAADRAALDAQIQDGRDIAANRDNPLATAQDCAALVHAQIVYPRHGVDYEAATWATRISAELGHAPYDGGDRPGVFNVETPRLTVAACLLQSLFRVRDGLYADGLTREGRHIVAVTEMIRSNVLRTIDGHQRLLEIVDANVESFHATRRFADDRRFAPAGGERS